MKLVVQIPCYNEASTLARTIGEIPRQVAGIDKVLVLVIDDGSEDRTSEIAKQTGADRVVRLPQKTGLANAFVTGLENALQMGADIIVNTDGDNQYPGREIPKLIDPVLKGRADLAIAERGLAELPGYSRFKLVLQRLGSWFTGLLAGVEIKDAPSGFRALSREAALKLNVYGKYTYTIETLIEAGRSNMRLAWVPVPVNPQPGRQSRLYANIGQYLARSVEAMVRTYSRYEPLRVFLTIGGLVFASGFGIGAWFLYFFFTAGGKGHVQILILAAVLMIIGFQVILIGLVADLISGNRKLLEELIQRMRKLDHQDSERNS
jgi:glycosyltransferase involved in cell wall biosynthesis